MLAQRRESFAQDGPEVETRQLHLHGRQMILGADEFGVRRNNVESVPVRGLNFTQKTAFDTLVVNEGQDGVLREDFFFGVKSAEFR